MKERLSKPGRDAVGFGLYDMTLALQEAPSLGEENLPRVGKESVDTWVAYWRRKGLLKSKKVSRFPGASLWKRGLVHAFLLIRSVA